MYIVTAAVNGWDYTERLIHFLSRINTVPIRLIVVDNGSSDTTSVAIASMHRGNVPVTAGGVMLVSHDRNTGAAGAWNLGIRLALLNSADQILVLGNDTLPMPGTVERLSDLLNQGVPFVTGTAVPYDSAEVFCPLARAQEPLIAAPDFSCFALMPLVIEALARWDAMMEFAVLQQAAQQTGAGEPIQRPLALCKPWDYGLFDERYSPAYFEDSDYHLRLQRAGICAVRDPGALFRHETSLSIRINPELAQANQHTFVQNAELFKAKWGGLPHEVEAIPGSNQRPINARPLNVTAEQWQAMTAGHPVEELPREHIIAQAKAVYGRYGIAA